MFNLSGKISDRIRAGKIPADLKFKGAGDAPPTAKAIKDARGQGLGKGATRRRSGSDQA